MKTSYQDNSIAIIFIMVAWPEEAYEISFYKKCSKRDFPKIVLVPDRSFLRSSGALPGLSRSPSGPEFRDLAIGTPPGPQNPAKKIKNQKKKYKTPDLPPQRLIC